jgi:hypothetical protein
MADTFGTPTQIEVFSSLGEYMAIIIWPMFLAKYPVFLDFRQIRSVALASLGSFEGLQFLAASRLD